MRSIAPAARLQASSIHVGVIGPATAGKSLVCDALYEKTAWTVFRADEKHDPEWIKNPTPLTTEQRDAWADRVCSGFEATIRTHPCTILDCSALTHAMQRRLLALDDGLVLIFLDISLDIALERAAVRRIDKGHFFREEELIRDQFRVLEIPEPDERTYIVDAEQDPAKVVADAWEIVSRIHTGTH